MEIFLEPHVLLQAAHPDRSIPTLRHLHQSGPRSPDLPQQAIGSPEDHTWRMKSAYTIEDDLSDQIESNEGHERKSKKVIGCYTDAE